MSLSRRDLGKSALGSLLTYTLLETIFTRDLLAADGKRVTKQWYNDLQQLSVDLRGKKFSQVDWMQKVDELYATVDLPELLTLLKFDELKAGVKYKDQGEVSLRPKFPEVEGLPTRVVFGQQIFALKKGRSVVPHGHDNMATAFLILQGDFHGRHYDRLEDTADSMIIRPTIDRAFTAGDHSTVSDNKDNVHWFTATSDTAFIYNIHVLNVNPDKKENGRIYIDPNGEKLSEGRIKARRISSTEVYKLYG